MKTLLKVGGIGCLGLIVLTIVGLLLPDLPETEATRQGGASTVRSAPRPTPVRIEWEQTSANSLLAAYEDNEIAAHRRFADRPLEIRGYAGRPDYAPFNERRYLVPIQSSDMFVFSSLHCEVKVGGEHENWVLGLSDGTSVTVRGYIRDNMDFGIVELEDCTPVR